MKVIKGNFSHKTKTQGNEKKNLPKPDSDFDNAYSTMFFDLIKNYLDPAADQDLLESRLQLGIVAWNMAISKSMGIPQFKEIFDSTMEVAALDKHEVELVKKIMKEKLQKYPGHDHFIKSYKIEKGEKGIPNVLVTHQNMTQLLDDTDFDDEEFSGEYITNEELNKRQFEVGFVNRSAVSLKHKPAFIEWIRQNDEFFNETLQIQDNTIYLIKEKISPDEALKWIKKNFAKMMVNELENITVDEKNWPKRTYQVFRDLFEIGFHNMVLDLEEEPLIKD